jgi:glycosyltransferase involved in cell wall biosynthesis
MSSRPRFTVVIPAFNSGGFIDATLASLSEQTCRDFEAIVVDDRSSDNTVAVAERSIEQHRLRGRIVVRGADMPKGVSTCRNLGLQLAQGDWVAFLDSDDLFASHKLERTSEAIERWGKIASVIYHPSERFEDTTLRQVDVVGVAPAGGPRDVLEQLLRGNFLATCGLVAHRSLVRDIGGFDLSLHGIEDYWLGIQLAARSPFAYIDEPLARIRVRSDSLMGNRHLTHYARQHARLLHVARRSRILTRAQLRLLRDSLWAGPMRWHASYRLPQGGWRELIPTVWVFARNGCAALGLRLLGAFMRHRTLMRVSLVARRLRSRRPRPSAL